MRQTHKIPELIDPQALNTTNGQEAWRVMGIMAEFAIATERLRGIRPAVSIFGIESHFDGMSLRFNLRLLQMKRCAGGN